MPNQGSAEAMEALKLLFGAPKYVIGMVHLRPLPGSPRWDAGMREVLERAVADARALEGGGLDGLIVENFGDVPFCRGRVEAHTVSAMTLAVTAVRETVGIAVGVNVLRNDSGSALAIAVVTGASFIRVNVHVGAMVTDQGIVEGNAQDTVRYRRELGADVKIFADMMVKHAVPQGGQTIEQVARDTAYRGLADALIVTGSGTAEPTDLEDVVRTRSAVPDVPVLVGSGVHEGNVAELSALADGVIVGTSLTQDGITTYPVDRTRVARLMAIVRESR